MTALQNSDRLVLYCGTVICAAMIATLLAVGFNPLVPIYHLNNLLVFAMAWIFVIGIMLLYRLARARPESPIRFLRHDFFDAPTRLASQRALLYSLLLATFGTLFSLAKRSIPLFNSYSWDKTFIALDQAIHGRDAWLVLQPLLGYPLITWILGLFYHVWVLLIYLGNFYFIFYETDDQLRSRYVLAYMLSWTLIGFVAAAIFASVGPCFVGPILGIDHFAGQMAYLRSVDAQFPLMFLNVQDQLLSWYRDDAALLGAGIAAMPSMHVAQAFLFFFAMRHKPRWVSLLFGAFAVFILVASVHVGYHYAVDGYVAIVLAAIVWCASGVFIRRMTWIFAARENHRDSLA
jgi:membrane-associated phospholipid phosphatase